MFFMQRFFCLCSTQTHMATRILADIFNNMIRENRDKQINCPNLSFLQIRLNLCLDKFMSS